MCCFFLKDFIPRRHSDTFTNFTNGLWDWFWLLMGLALGELFIWRHQCNASACGSTRRTLLRNDVSLNDLWNERSGEHVSSLRRFFHEFSVCRDSFNFNLITGFETAPILQQVHSILQIHVSHIDIITYPKAIHKDMSTYERYAIDSSQNPERQTSPRKAPKSKSNLPETNSSYLKMDGWNTSLTFVMPYFQGRLLLVPGRVLNTQLKIIWETTSPALDPGVPPSSESMTSWL